MIREERARYCSYCRNKRFDPKIGVICGLTNSDRDFGNECPDLDKDEALFQLEEEARKEMELSEETMGMQGLGVKDGVTAGAILIILSVVWLIAGLMINRIFIYSFIGVGIGIVAIIKGSAKKKENARKKMLKEQSLDQFFDD